MSDAPNYYAKSLEMAEAAEEGIGTHPEAANTYAQLASAYGALAMCDAVYNLRNHVEELPVRLERRLGGGRN